MSALPTLTLVNGTLKLNLPDGSLFKILPDSTKCVLGKDMVKVTSIYSQELMFEYRKPTYKVVVRIAKTKTVILIDNGINVVTFDSCGRVHITDIPLDTIGSAFTERLVDSGSLEGMLTTLKNYPEIITISQDLLDNRRRRMYKKFAGIAEYGRELGYPDCCIDEFLMTRMDGMQYLMLDHNRKLTGSGYIPCCKCNKKTEQELISEIRKRRNPKYAPFPFSIELSKLDDKEKDLTQLLNPETLVALFNLYCRH